MYDLSSGIQGCVRTPKSSHHYRLQLDTANRITTLSGNRRPEERIFQGGDINIFVEYRLFQRDLDILYGAGVVEYKQNGRAKRPVLAHKNVFVKPVVFEGEPMEDINNHTDEIAAD
ncbi:hypothetical protein ACFFQF_23135 [Haladaptatus pallidirubidus]|uniref:Uncharacterized protein n=1 Tax=Haladaptatus pallidirubidus TaxID=1008152 RepID=A0AAV3UP13_9EURY|nr:hypothetical protein [Haladaptatus pallidirubidus]